MKDVYLTKNNGSVMAFYSQKDMEAAGFSQADKIVSDEEFNGNGCYARVIEGEIVVGKTAGEVAEEEKQAQIDALKTELAAIDQAAGAGRIIRAVTLEAAQAAGLELPDVDSTTIRVEDDDLTRLCKCERRANELRAQFTPLADR